MLRPTQADDTYLSNADGDDLYFIHEGSGSVRSELGDLSFEKWDYVCVPKGIVHRFELDPDRTIGFESSASGAWGSSRGGATVRVNSEWTRRIAIAISGGLDSTGKRNRFRTK